MLQLSPEEAGRYRGAVDRLRDTCEIVLDLSQPITVEEWMFLQVAYAALDGDLDLLDGVMAKVEAEIRARKQRI